MRSPNEHLSGDVSDGSAQAIAALLTGDSNSYLFGLGKDDQAMLEGNNAASIIPGVLHVYVGTSLVSERDTVDDSFDVGIVITFPDRAAMASYLVHPTHTHAVHEIIRPLVRKIVVYDISE